MFSDLMTKAKEETKSLKVFGLKWRDANMLFIVFGSLIGVIANNIMHTDESSRDRVIQASWTGALAGACIVWAISAARESALRPKTKAIEAKLKRRNKPFDPKVTGFKRCKYEPSSLLTPMTLKFDYEGVTRKLPVLDGCDKYICMLFHKKLESVIFIREFHASVYFQTLKQKGLTKESKPEDECQTKSGNTLEFLSGTMKDDGLSIIQSVVETIRTRSRFNVSDKDLHVVAQYSQIPAMMSALTHCFYCEVSDIGRLKAAGEREDWERLLYVHVSELQKVVRDHSVESDTLFMLYWFLQTKRELCYT